MIQVAISIVVENKGLDDIKSVGGILRDGSIMTVDFFNDEKIFRLRSTIGVKPGGYGEETLYFKEEEVYSKVKSAVKSRSNLFDFSDKDVEATRAIFEKEHLSFLKPQDSVCGGICKK